MKRRTLDLVLGTVALVLAVLLFGLGLILQNQADFATTYVHDQLAAQRITFTPADQLPDQVLSEPGTDCLLKYAEQPLVTGKEAECYANYFIAILLSGINNGKTYSETSDEQMSAAADAIAAKNAGAANASQLQAKSDQLATATATLFRGETLRGLLLTSYGFSIMGERAQQSALVLYTVGFILFLASVIAVVHAFATPKDVWVFFPGRRDSDPPGTMVAQRPQSPRQKRKNQERWKKQQLKEKGRRTTDEPDATAGAETAPGGTHRRKAD